MGLAMRAARLTCSELKDMGDLSLRKVDSRDAYFQQQLFRSCRPHLAQIPMPVEFVDALVQQQYNLQRNAYGQHFPEYLYFLILLHQEPIGSLKLHEDNHAARLHLLDIGFLPEHRSRGHGSALLRAMQTVVAKQGWALCLSVDRQNWRARKLYSALGFQVVEHTGTHDSMIWKAVACLVE